MNAPFVLNIKPYHDLSPMAKLFKNETDYVLSFSRYGAENRQTLLTLCSFLCSELFSTFVTKKSKTAENDSTVQVNVRFHLYVDLTAR